MGRSSTPPDEGGHDLEPEARAGVDPEYADAVEHTRQIEEEEIFPAYDEAEEDVQLNPVHPFLGQRDTVPEDEKQTMRLEIPTRTIVKVILTLVAIWLVLQVASVFLLLLLAVILCLALLPVVRRLENRGLPRGLAVATVFAGLVALVAGFLWVIVPPVVTQTQNLIDNAPEYVENFDDILDRYPSVRDQVDEYFGIGDVTEEPDEPEAEGGTPDDAGAPVDAATVQAGASAVISFGASVVGGLANAFFVVVLALYLLVEGERTWRYFARYMTPALRYRFHRLGPQLTQVVSGYVLGQAIISTMFGVFSYIVLFVLDVPQPLLLALFGAVAVAIPIVGVPVATLAAMAIALAVSWQTSLIVFAAFMIYQQFENYVLLPRVYGNTLQVTSLSILVGVLVGGQLMGVLGIILSLPLTASIPVIERIWREQLPEKIEEMEAAETTARARDDGASASKPA
jgi:predicted PurR-regulated permease PerM